MNILIKYGTARLGLEGEVGGLGYTKTVPSG